MKLEHAVGRALKELRMGCGISQHEIGVSQNIVSHIESGKRLASIAEIDRLAGALGLHPLTIVAKASLLRGESASVDELMARVRAELESHSRVDLARSPLR